MGYGFSKINLQGARSRDGFTVQFTGRFTLEYREGGFVMECYVEPGPVFQSVQVPQLPFGNLTSELRTEIVQRVSAALDFMDLQHRIC
jgi:hypothetical protein